MSEEIKAPKVIRSETKPDVFGHPYVRFVGRGDTGGRWVESCVYNIETGEKHLCWPVDARELVKSGEYSYDPPGVAPGTVPPAPDVDNPEHAVGTPEAKPVSRRAAAKKKTKE